MTKKSISSVELAALVNELQFLAEARITKIYQQEKELLLELYLSNHGKELLKIIAGKFIFLAKSKETAPSPSNFCLQLRKHLDNAVIKAIYQKDSERIIVLELEKKEEGKKICYNLMVELFSKGNIILTDEKKQIIAVLEQQSWKERAVKVREQYKFPRCEVNWKELSLEKLQAILKKTAKTNLAACLATEIGLGGLYAEEACKYAHVGKELSPPKLGKEKIKALLQAIKKLNASLQETKGHIYETEITPFPLSGLEPKQILPTYNEALATIKLDEKISPYQKKIKALEYLINEQEEAIKKQEEQIAINQQKGEKIYEYYADLQKLLEIVRELKKDKEWSEIELELKKVKKIKKIELKNKKITLDL